MNGTKINLELINKKHKPYDLKFDKNLFKEKVLEKAKTHCKEINKLVKIYPSFKECHNTICTKINQ